MGCDKATFRVPKIKIRREVCRKILALFPGSAQSGLWMNFWTLVSTSPNRMAICPFPSGLLQCGRSGFSLWVGKILWRREWQPTPVFLPGKSHGTLPGSSVHKIFPGKNTGVSGHFLLQRIFPTQGPNSHPLHWQTDSLPLSHLGSPYLTSVQFSSVAQSCPTLCNPMNRSTPGLPVHHQLPEFTQTHIHRVSDAIQPSQPLSSPSPPAPNPSQQQSLFQWVNSSHEVAKVLEFQL